jgi:hypothetical protein
MEQRFAGRRGETLSGILIERAIKGDRVHQPLAKRRINGERHLGGLIHLRKRLHLPAEMPLKRGN